MAGAMTRQKNKQQQLLLVAWLSGSEIAYERNMQHEKEQTSGCSEQEQHHGWSPMGKGMMRRGSKVADDKLNHFTLSLDCTPSFTEVTPNDTAILDSGCTSNFLSAAAPCSDKQAAHVPLNVNMPNGTTIQLSHTCNLLLTDLPPQARQAHILPGIVHNSLISVGQLCDNGFSVTFTQDQVTV
jgi:hypothetical protein